MRVPRGLVVATAAATALVWGLYALDPSAWPGLTGAIAQTALLLANVVVTTRSPRTKILIVRAIQRRVVNPLVRLLFRAGINPLGLAILETRGRVSGQPRRTPVGNGRVGDEFWIIAEHGRQAGYGATSSTTRECGSGSASDGATAGFPESPRSVRTTTHWRGSGR